MCGAKLVIKMKNDLKQMLGLEETIDQPTKGNSVRWYGHVFRKA